MHTRTRASVPGLVCRVLASAGCKQWLSATGHPPLLAAQAAAAVQRRWHTVEKLAVAREAFDIGTERKRKLRRAMPSYDTMVAPLSKYLGRPADRPVTKGEVLSDLSREQIHELLATTDRALETALFEHADTVSDRFFGPKIHFRGLIEFSNVCQKSCGYCGIRKGIEVDQKTRASADAARLWAAAHVWESDGDTQGAQRGRAHTPAPAGERARAGAGAVGETGNTGFEDFVPLHRYTMTRREVVETAVWAYENGYGSVMLQSGELATETRLRWLCDVIRRIKDATVAAEAAATGKPASECRGLGIALSVGELDEAAYQRLFDAGAHRYLLRIETSNADLYATLHPRDGQHEWDRRVECIRSLGRVGFQVGTGVMIGLPGQTLWDLAGDIDFFREIDADMVGMGPYVLQEDTPVGRRWMRLHPDLVMPEVAESAGVQLLDAAGGVDAETVAAAKEPYTEAIFNLSTRMLAVARVVLGNVNIAATTALQAINAGGREIALTRGANLMMPILTPRKYREDYQLYEGKPCIDEGAADCRGCLSMRVRTAGKEIAWDEWGDPPHYFGDDAVVRD